MNSKARVFLGRLAALALLFIAMGGASAAQTSVGAIHGQVTDPSSAVVAGLAAAAPAV